MVTKTSCYLMVEKVLRPSYSDKSPLPFPAGNEYKFEECDESDLSHSEGDLHV